MPNFNLQFHYTLFLHVVEHLRMVEATCIYIISFVCMYSGPKHFFLVLFLSHSNLNHNMAAHSVLLSLNSLWLLLHVEERRKTYDIHVHVATVILP